MSRPLLANIADQGFARITVAGERIAGVEILGELDPEAPHCSGGLIDIQLNGYAGIDFSADDLTPKHVTDVLPALWATGVTSFCPTLITNSPEALVRNFRVLEEARSAFPMVARMIPCYHLEGPYLSPGASRGAHDKQWMRTPDCDEFARFQRAAGGRIGILTLAPELPKALELTRSAAKAGVRVAISHTDCNPEEIHAAVDAGATLATHLGNGCPEMINRHRAPIWAQMVREELNASIICDGFHLPSELVRIIWRMKAPDKCILITDASHVAGLPAGRYRLVTTDVELLPSGKVVTTDGRSMAGSSLRMNRAVRNFMTLACVSLGAALEAAVSTPARFLGRAQVCSRVAAGEVANLILFRPAAEELAIESCMLAGEQVFP